MEFYNKVKSQQDQPDQGELKVSVFTEDGTRPVENALVRISYTGESGQTVEEVRTDSSGQTPTLELKTPPLEYSMEPVEEQPYADVYDSGAGGRLKIQNCRNTGITRRGGAAIDKNGISGRSIF